MSPRNSAKAIVVNNGKILLNRCCSQFGEYYALPGGGQNRGETLDEALKREILEETGYTVSPIRLSGIYERIATGRDDDLFHKIYFVFLCKLEPDKRKRPTERDKFQIDHEWVDVDKITNVNLFPKVIREAIPKMLTEELAIFLGSERY